MDAIICEIASIRLLFDVVSWCCAANTNGAAIIGADVVGWVGWKDVLIDVIILDCKTCTTWLEF